MTKPFQAIYELGVLRPLEPLAIDEHEVVTLIVTRGNGCPSRGEGLRDDLIDYDLMAIAEREAEGEIPLEELHERLKSIRGSMSDVVINERGEY